MNYDVNDNGLKIIRMKYKNTADIQTKRKEMGYQIPKNRPKFPKGKNKFKPTKEMKKINKMKMFRLLLLHCGIVLTLLYFFKDEVFNVAKQIKVTLVNNKKQEDQQGPQLKSTKFDKIKRHYMGKAYFNGIKPINLEKIEGTKNVLITLENNTTRILDMNTLLQNLPTK